MLEALCLRNLQENLFGLYEKALPKQLNWEERLRAAKEAGYDFMEISIDESDERIGRLKWSMRERTKLMETIHRVNMPILSMCLSANRRYPIGSEAGGDAAKWHSAHSGDAIDFALDCGIRVIQLAGVRRVRKPQYGDDHPKPFTILSPSARDTRRKRRSCLLWRPWKTI